MLHFDCKAVRPGLRVQVRWSNFSYVGTLYREPRGDGRLRVVPDDWGVLIDTLREWRERGWLYAFSEEVFRLDDEEQGQL